MVARPGQFFIITAVLISGVILAVSTITPTYYISQPDQTLRIGLITDSVDGVTEAGLATLEIGNKAKLGKYERRFAKNIFDSLSRLRYNDVTVKLNATPDLSGNVSGRVDIRPMLSSSPPIFTKIPATISAIVDYTLISPSFNIHYFSKFNTSATFAGTDPATRGIVLVVDPTPPLVHRLTLPIFYTVNGVPYENAAFEIGKVRGQSGAAVTIIDIEQIGNGIYILTIDYTDGSGQNTRRFSLEIYTAVGARTDIVIRT